MKRILVCFISILAVFGLSACTDNSIKLKVWVNQNSQDFTKKMVEEFVAQYPKDADGKAVKFKITVEPLSEADAKTEVTKDPEAAADVFNMASDQLRDLVNAGALAEIVGDYKEAIEEENSEASWKAAMIGEKLYAYPLTADNGYFMYYDKSVFREPSQLETLDGMIEIAKGKDQNVAMDLADGFFIASFLYANGNTMTYNATDNKYTANFNDEAGLQMADTLQKYLVMSAQATSTNITGFSNSPAGDFASNIGEGKKFAACVSGTWIQDAVKTALGANYGAVKLPTVSINDQQKQLASFAGFKFMGVKAASKHPVEANALAAWLTNESNQLTRYKEVGFCPSNIEAADDKAVQENIAIVALNSQLKAKGIPQVDIPGTYWTSATALTKALVEGTGASATGAPDVEDLLTTFVNSLK